MAKNLHTLTGEKKYFSSKKNCWIHMQHKKAFFNNFFLAQSSFSSDFKEKTARRENFSKTRGRENFVCSSDRGLSATIPWSTRTSSVHETMTAMIKVYDWLKLVRGKIKLQKD